MGMTVLSALRSPRSLGILLLSLGLCSAPANAREFSREGLGAVKNLIETAVAEGRISAGLAVVARDGAVIWREAAGEMSPGIPLRADAIMPLASLGKMLTATAAMILVERGAMALEDPVSQFLPEFADVMVLTEGAGGRSELTVPKRPITVYHLLTHTGGLSVDGEAFWAAWDEHVGNTTTSAFARALAAQPLFAQPGEKFAYGATGASYEVLGAVIEVASGQTLEAFMTASIFSPLGLSDSYFYVPEEKLNRLPAIYRKTGDGLWLERAAGKDFARSTFFQGGGGVSSSAADIVRFARLFLERGSVDGVTILQPETIKLMMSDQLGNTAPEHWKAQGKTWGFGSALKFSTGLRGAATLEQFGWVGGGFAKLWVDPIEHLIAYINFPLTPPGDMELLEEFERRVYAALVAPLETRLP